MTHPWRKAHPFEQSDHVVLAAVEAHVVELPAHVLP